MSDKARSVNHFFGLFLDRHHLQKFPFYSAFFPETWAGIEALRENEEFQGFAKDILIHVSSPEFVHELVQLDLERRDRLVDGLLVIPVDLGR